MNHVIGLYDGLADQFKNLSVELDLIAGGETETLQTCKKNNLLFGHRNACALLRLRRGKMKMSFPYLIIVQVEALAVSAVTGFRLPFVAVREITILVQGIGLAVFTRIHLGRSLSHL